MAVEQQWPNVVAMVVADVVYRDNASGKFSAIGIYSSLAAREFPCTQPALAVYLCLTDGRGETPLQIRLVDVDESRPPVFESERTVTFADPTDVLELSLVQPDVVFPEPGEYRLQLFSAGQFLHEWRLWVLPRDEAELQ